MSKVYEIDRECTVWTRETYVLDGTDEENEKFLKEMLDKERHERDYVSSVTLEDTIEEIENGRAVIQTEDVENSDTIEIFSR